MSLYRYFFWRRMHSLMGLWLVIFLLEHLITNSQAALYLGEDGIGFIRSVNLIHSLPYLPVIELSLLGFPIAMHALLGIKYLRGSLSNSFPTDGTTPSLPQYVENHAYTWQRITSWILLFAIVGHVVQMRFLDYPSKAKVGSKTYYMVSLKKDPGIETLAARLGVELYDQEKSVEEKISKVGSYLVEQQKAQQLAEFKEVLQMHLIEEGGVVAVAPSFGIAELLIVRETFKSPLMIFLYTIFVLSAVFHAFNGFWTFLITWGFTLSDSGQRISRNIASGLMFVIGALGLAAIYGTYWLNLYS